MLKQVGMLQKDKEGKYVFEYYGEIDGRRCIAYLSKTGLLIYEVPEELGYLEITKALFAKEEPKSTLGELPTPPPMVLKPVKPKKEDPTLFDFGG